MTKRRYPLAGADAGSLFGVETGDPPGDLALDCPLLQRLDQSHLDDSGLHVSPLHRLELWGLRTGRGEGGNALESHWRTGETHL